MVALSPHITQFEYKHKYRALSAAAVGVAVFTGVFLLIGEFAPVEKTSAERINVNIGDGAYYMNITADDLDIDIDATPAGVTESVQKDIVVSTNSGTGYKLYLSMNNNETNGNRLYYNGDKTNTNYIIPTSSSSLSTNSWGYSTDGSSFSAVPLQGNEAVIGQSATSPSSPVTHSVYYGFNVNNTLPFGSYSGVVTYTAVADAAASPTAHTSVANYLDDKSMADPAGGDTLVITTSLMTNMQDLGNITVSVGGTNCPVTGTSTASKFAEVSCTMPAKSAGSYAVAVTFAKFSKTYNTTISYYDSGLSFGAGMNKIRTMQGMTTDVCNAITTPAAFTTGTTINTDVPYGTIKDTRDSKYYLVNKLADGNCWMGENLKLDLVAGNTVTASKNDGSTFEFNVTSGNASDYDVAINGMRLAPKGTTGIYYYGTYAATAGMATSSSPAGDIDGSICPQNWKMPYAKIFSFNKSYSKLWSTYGMPENDVQGTDYAPILTAAPFNYNLDGVAFGNGDTWGVNDIAYLRSSSIFNTKVPYFSAFTQNSYAGWNYSPNSYNDGNDAFKDSISIRCVAL